MGSRATVRISGAAAAAGSGLRTATPAVLVECRCEGGGMTAYLEVWKPSGIELDLREFPR